MPRIPVELCCGCTSCSSVCPKSAITMKPDAEGFLYPDVDTTSCIDCHLCEKVCPVLTPPQTPKDFADCIIAQSCDEEALSQSTSGGFIDALCRYVLEELSGFAAGAAYDEEFLPEHKIVGDYESAKAFRNSKYAQSELSDTFIKVRELLKRDSYVLFIGTPCQVAGLKCFLQKEYSNLITADFVCRSIPSPKLWREYLDWQEQRHKAKIQSVFCRKKTYGYHSGALEIYFAGGKHYAGSNRVDYYMKSFHSDICSRPSCYDCRFKTQHRCSDFTVFDSWNPKMSSLQPLEDNDLGYSNVLVHTEKGKNLISKIRNVTSYPADPERMFQFTGAMERQSIRRREAREAFYVDLDHMGFYKTVKKYVNVTLADRAIERLKPIRYYKKRRK